MELISVIGKDKENWGQVVGLIKRGKWDKVIIAKDRDSDDFPYGDETIEVDTQMPLSELKVWLMEELKKKISGDFEVALSIASGSGKEHMAIISSLLNLPVGIKLVVFTKKGIEYIT